MMHDRTIQQVGKTRDNGITFSAVLLAGGESRRMGRDKTVIVFGDEPLWRRQLRMLRDLKFEKIFVSARTPSSWLPADTELLLDEPPSRGPLSGLTTALLRMQTSHLLVLAVDMPFLTREHLDSLRAMVARGVGIVPALGQRAEPLAAIYPAEVAADFTTALAGSDFSLQRIVRRLVRDGKIRLHAVPEEEHHFYRSLNEPADLA